MVISLIEVAAQTSSKTCPECGKVYITRSQCAFHRAMAHFHVPITRTGDKGIPLQAILDLYAQGDSMSLIAKKLGCCEANIHHRLKKAGVNRPMGVALSLAWQQGRVNRKSLKGETHPGWKGGRYVSNGYVYVYCPDHNRSRHNHVAEHILVWERVHNKPLPNGFVIHHLNGIKNDNRPENLVALPKTKHGHKFIKMIEAKARRIRELELNLDILKKSLETKQAIFYINNN